MTDLSALIARVEEGNHADRTLDGEVFIALSPECQAAGRVDHMDGVVGWWPKGGPYESAHPVPSFTGSLDAVLSLIEQKLPGWCPDVGKVPPFALAPDDYEWTGALMGNEREVTYGHGEPPEMAFDTYNGHANSGARALLAATLRAIQSKEDQTNE